MLDAVVIGAGHNGLVCAAGLARAGWRVRVVERRDRVGGACVTEEIWPGYRVSRAAYVAGLLRPAVLRELDLARHGLRLLRRRPSSFTPRVEGGGLLLGAGPEADREALARFSPRDAARYPRYEAWLDRAARALEPLLDAPPTRLPWPAARDWVPLLRAGRRALALGVELAPTLGLVLGAARPVLESWFESELLRATLATDAVIGAWAAPSTPGTGLVLLHHVLGETGGARGVWAYVEGGMGSLAEALARAARAAGAAIELEAPVRRILVEGGRARGVELEGGRRVAARWVISNADPRRTLLGLLPPGVLAPDRVRALKALDLRSGSVKVNLALDRLPRFRGASGGPAGAEEAGPEHAGTIHVGATTLDALERAFLEAQAGRVPDRPIVELTLPSALDGSLAPPGRHVASLFVQWVPLDPGPEGGWGRIRERIADRALAAVEEVAPGFRSSVLHAETLLPVDLERIFGLSGGHLFHGAMGPAALGPLRPLAGMARYETPVAGLALCGAGTHPGGGVMGACGRNAARVILARDRRV